LNEGAEFRPGEGRSSRVPKKYLTSDECQHSSVNRSRPEIAGVRFRTLRRRAPS
jgi:hypothetical protein